MNAFSATLGRIACRPGADHAVLTSDRLFEHPMPRLGPWIGSIWRLDRMVGAASRGDAPAMSVSPARRPAGPAPDNELYDRGCDLVEAAAGIRRLAGAREAARAVPAVLGCIEAALQELLWASAALEETTARSVEERTGGCTESRLNARFERMQRGYANLQRTLADAERASAAARSLAGRALASAGATGTTGSRR
jgi:hypothetical protein